MLQVDAACTKRSVDGLLEAGFDWEDCIDGARPNFLRNDLRLSMLDPVVLSPARRSTQLDQKTGVETQERALELRLGTAVAVALPATCYMLE